MLNWIAGRTHLGGSRAPVPRIFGMNFQSVSVGQKLIENGVPGGYTDAEGTPTPAMSSEIEFVDAAIGQMVEALRARGLSESTALIVTAKHGQSPIDPHRFLPIPGHANTNGTPPSDLLASYLPASETGGIGPTEDDISLLWLNHANDTQAAVGILEAHASAAGIGQIFFGSSLDTMFNRPGLPSSGATRALTSSFSQCGVVCTGSLKSRRSMAVYA